MLEIAATGRFVPHKRESNSDLEQELDLEPGWIARRTGVQHRALADQNDAVSDLACRAGRSAIAEFEQKESATTSGGKISIVILATSTPDHLLPPSSPKVAYDLGLKDAAAFDLTVACSGFLYGLIVAESLVRSQSQPALLIAANILSRRCRKTDAKTRPIFGDAAGAVVVAPSPPNKPARFFSEWESDGSDWSSLMIPDGGSRSPVNADTYNLEQHLMELSNGSAVFKYAVESMTRLGHLVMQQAGVTPAEVDWWIPHQANIRIIEAVRKQLKFSSHKTLTTLEQFGNSSAATIPVTLDYFRRQTGSRKIESGQRILMTSAAAGMTSAAVLMEIA